jgi:hypothetical protein
MKIRYFTTTSEASAWLASFLLVNANASGFVWSPSPSHITVHVCVNGVPSIL